MLIQYLKAGVVCAAVASVQVKQFGMSESVGAISYKEENGFFRPHSGLVHDEIDTEVRRLIQVAYDSVMELLTERRAEMDKVQHTPAMTHSSRSAVWTRVDHPAPARCVGR